MFIVAAVAAAIIEIWRGSDPEVVGSTRAERLYGFVGLAMFISGLFSSIFDFLGLEVLGFSNNVTLIGIGLSLFGVVDSWSIARNNFQVPLGLERPPLDPPPGTEHPPLSNKPI